MLKSALDKHKSADATLLSPLQVGLAQILEKTDSEAAVKLLHEALGAKNAIAAMMLAAQSLGSGDESAATELEMKALQWGYGDAAVHIAKRKYISIQDGSRLIVRDAPRAIALLEQGVKGGSGRSAYLLALLSANGEYCALDYERAKKLVVVAVQQDVPGAAELQAAIEGAAATGQRVHLRVDGVKK